MVVSKPRAAHGLPTATVVEGDYIATVHTAWDLPFAPTVMTTTESVNAHEPQVSMTDELLTRDVEALDSRTSLPQQPISLSQEKRGSAVLRNESARTSTRSTSEGWSCEGSGAVLVEDRIIGFGLQHVFCSACHEDHFIG